jgi:GNAT superfamily N-acetyltransferase
MRPEVKVRRMGTLDSAMLARLKELTNNPHRGDLRDDGRQGGSSMREHIYDHIDGLAPEAWALIAYPTSMRRTLADIGGWALLALDRDEPLVVRTGVVGFYVDPAFRRLGLGRGLIGEASQVARKNGMCRLVAHPWNRSSLSFFLSCGFDEVHGYGASGHDGVVAKDLDVDTTAGRRCA